MDTGTLPVYERVTHTYVNTPLNNLFYVSSYVCTEMTDYVKSRNSQMASVGAVSPPHNTQTATYVHPCPT